VEAVEPPLCSYLAEWYKAGLSANAVDDAIRRLTHASAATHDGAAVSLLAMFAAPKDEVLYGVFTAASPTSVIQACILAGYPIDRLTVDIDARILAPNVPERCL